MQHLKGKLRDFWFHQEVVGVSLPSQPFPPLNLILTGHPTEYRTLDQLRLILKAQKDPDPKNLEVYRTQFHELPLVFQPSLEDEWKRIEVLLEKFWASDRFENCSWGTWVVGDHDGRSQDPNQMRQVLERMQGFLAQYPGRTFSLDLRFHRDHYLALERDFLGKEADPDSDFLSLYESFLETSLKIASPTWEQMKGSLDLIMSFLSHQIRPGWSIISFTQEEADLKRAFAFLNLLGVQDQWKVCPLFETTEDLKSASNWLDWSLWQKGFGGEPLRCLIGFSDTNKSCGFFSSHVLLRQLWEKLLQDTSGQVEFFYGRGSSMSRGGGALDDFLKVFPRMAFPQRLTVQGEALYRELWLGEVSLGERVSEKEKFAEEFWSGVAAQAEKVYVDLKECEGFWPFFLAFTPCVELARWNLSSRPSVRNREFQWKNLRAIAWVSSWNQSGLFFSSWFGAGKALFDVSDQEIPWTPFYYFLLQQLNWVRHLIDEEILGAYLSLVPSDLTWFFDEIEKDRHFLDLALDRLKPGLTFFQKKSLDRYRQFQSNLKEVHLIQVQLLKDLRDEGKKESELLFRESVACLASGYGFFA